jgi:hypothetical protein
MQVRHLYVQYGDATLALSGAGFEFDAVLGWQRSLPAAAAKT